MARSRRLNLDEDGPERDAAYDALVARVALAVRTAYFREYNRVRPGRQGYGSAPIPQWDGGTNRAGDKCQPIWPKIAKELIRQNADPFDFIHAQFATHERGEPPRPNMILKPEAWHNFRQQQMFAVDHLRTDLKRQIALYARRLQELAMIPRLTETERVITALCDRFSLDASPLFRYVTALAMNLPALAAQFYDEAFMQYLFQATAYDAAWSDVSIPETIRTAAAQFRARFV